MKKIILSAMTVLVLLTLNPQAAQAVTENKQEITNTTLTQQEADALIARLYEINDMDKSTMDASEKKELRNEVLEIRDQLGPVLIISGGVLILIIILLILLL